MSWSKIKKAINSSLGTSNFKPLDKIIIEAFNYIKNKLSNLTSSLLSGENEFIVKRAKTADLADKASQMAIPNIHLGVNTSQSSITINNPEVGIYAVSRANLYDARITSFDTYLFYLSSSIIYTESESLPDVVPIHLISYSVSQGGAYAEYNAKQKTLFIDVGGGCKLSDVAFIKVNDENIII